MVEASAQHSSFLLNFKLSLSFCVIM
jgi:hypothetical protein